MAKRIAILTSGGDAPGMNAAIRAVVRAGLDAGFELYGVDSGYKGLIDGLDDISPDETVKISDLMLHGSAVLHSVRESELRLPIFPMDTYSVSDIILRGGTILRTAREMRLFDPEGRTKAAATLKKLEIDSLVVIGGDGSFHGAMLLKKEHGINTIGIPATIDNDLPYTDLTLGFNTALATCVHAISQIRETMNSHNRICFVEIMGRTCGDLALHAALGAGAEAALVPEVPFNFNQLCETLKNSHRRGKKGSIVTVAEGIADGNHIANNVAERTGLDVRYSRLGHIQRGGAPSHNDVILASCMGAHAIKLLQKDIGGRLVGVRNNAMIDVDIAEALAKKRKFRKDLYQLVHQLGK